MTCNKTTLLSITGLCNLLQIPMNPQSSSAIFSLGDHLPPSRTWQLIPLDKYCGISELFVSPLKRYRYGASLYNAIHSNGRLALGNCLKIEHFRGLCGHPKQNVAKAAIHFRYTRHDVTRQWRYMGCLQLKCSSCKTEELLDKPLHSSPQM